MAPLNPVFFAQLIYFGGQGQACLPDLRAARGVPVGETSVEQFRQDTSGCRETSFRKLSLCERQRPGPKQTKAN